eukprot:6394269-Pyramimonas_sp.AAC.1
MLRDRKGWRLWFLLWHPGLFLGRLPPSRAEYLGPSPSYILRAVNSLCQTALKPLAEIGAK